MTIQELLAEIAKNKDNTEFVSGLKNLNLVPKEVEVKEKPIDEAAVMAFLDGNQPVRDKIYNSAVKKHLSTKWKGEISNTDLGSELVAKSEIGEISKKYQDVILEMEIKAALGDKYDLLRPHISKEKIVIEEKDNKFTVTGVANELNAVKAKFPNLFTAPVVPPVEQPKDQGSGTGKKEKNDISTLETTKAAAKEKPSIKNLIEYERLKRESAQEGN